MGKKSVELTTKELEILRYLLRVASTKLENISDHLDEEVHMDDLYQIEEKLK